MGTNGTMKLLKYDEIFGAVSMSNYLLEWRVAELFCKFLCLLILAIILVFTVEN